MQPKQPKAEREKQLIKAAEHFNAVVRGPSTKAALRDAKARLMAAVSEVVTDEASDIYKGTRENAEFGEPWTVDDRANPPVVSATGGMVFPWNYDRAIACVNALAGIPHPEAVRELIEAATEWYGSVCKHGGSVQVPDTRLRRAVAALTAPPRDPGG